MSCARNALAEQLAAFAAYPDRIAIKDRFLPKWLAGERQ
jgi:hypothetical protein